MSGKLKYDTPCGSWVAQAQASGRWAAAYRLRSPVAPRDLEAVGAVWQRLPAHPSLPQLHSVVAAELRVNWTLPPTSPWVPLTALGRRLTPDEVKRVVVALGELLAVMHQGGAAAFDLSPSLILVDPTVHNVTLLPTLGLDLQARSAPLPAMPFVAPSLDSTDVARADVYGLGALARHLLTEGDAARSAGTLPGETDAALSGWDAFVDGCCRSNPARRYADIYQAVQALDAPPPEPPAVVAVAVPSAPRPRLATGNRWARRALLGVGGAALFLVAVLVLARDLIPGLGNNVERGFGDTVLRYRDRSYDGSTWVRVKDFDKLVESVTNGNRDTSNRPSTIELRRVVGWDDDNFWISAGLSTNQAILFGQKDGHWMTPVQMKEGGQGKHALRLLSRDTVLFVGQMSLENHIVEVSPAGTRKVGVVASQQWQHFLTEAVTVAPGLSFCCGDTTTVAKVTRDQVVTLAEDKFPAVHLHSPANLPIPSYNACWLRNARSPYEGEAFAIFWQSSYTGTPKLGHYHNDTWYAKEGDLPAQPINDMWLGGSAPDYFVVVVGPAARVHLRRVNQPSGRDQTLTAPGELTSLTLVKVWGVSPEKFWVMDDNGTVWETVEAQQGLESRVVLRGLQSNGVKFHEAWVSPSGTVLALTEKNELYRLERP